MLPRTRPASRLAVLALLSAGLFAFQRGWDLLWFLTDDAYIAFRFVSNSQLGHGYVWNAPPFLPVDGFTSFSWIVLLDWVWSALGWEPPAASNRLGFVFGAASLLLAAWMVLRMRLGEALRGWRVALMAIVVVGLTTNFTFLMWASGGLGTSLFNFLFLAWVASALWLRPGSVAWVAGASASAGLLAVTRPDGLLMFAATAAMLVVRFAGRRERPRWAHALAAAPLALPLAYLAWHRAFYGELLPNTYYAKHVAPWPEAGLRYLASYVLEYALWFWLLVAAAAALTAPGLSRALHPRTLWNALRDDRLPALAVVTTLLIDVGYYTLRVGGDHFEYRVYSHTVPLVLLSTVWMARLLVERGRLPRAGALVLPLAVVVLSWPIPWTVWSRARTARTYPETVNLVVPVDDLFPPGTRWYADAFERLQRWLIEGHAVAKRHHEHKVFLTYRLARFPRERQLGDEWYDEHRVYASKSVGVVGWIMARGHVIDTVGLNDWVIARNPMAEDRVRRMTHDREPPPGYVECFAPNVEKPLSSLREHDLEELAAFSAPPFRVRPRKEPLTGEDIAACERTWRERIVREER